MALNLNSKRVFAFLLLFFSFLLPQSSLADITGIAFHDYDGSGTNSSGNFETGIGGIDVIAYDSSGVVIAQTQTYDFNCTDIAVPDSTCTGAGAPEMGSYALNVPPTGNFRIEFTLPASGALDHLTASPGQDTSVQFAANGDVISAGFMSKGEYCQSDPEVLFACFSRNDSAGNPTSVAVSVPYTASGRDLSLKTDLAIADPDAGTPDAGTAVVGSVWGAAYNPLTDKFYVSAARRAYSGVGTDGLGAIHEIDLSGALPNNTLWNTIPNPGTFTQSFVGSFFGSRDPDGYENVGKVGIGDIDISEDYTKLYAMGLNDNGVLHEYSLTTGLLLNSYSVTDPGCDDSTDVRPWATKVHQGNVFIGVVCSEEAVGGADSDLRAFVMQLDEGTESFNTVATIPLDYPRHPASANCDTITGWFRWRSNISTFNDPASFCNIQGMNEVQNFPTPMFGDIEFDTDGSLIVAFIDRFAMQSPHFDFSPDPTDGMALFEANSGGDIRRLCFTGTTFIPEGSTGCAFNLGSGVLPNNEYYNADDFLFGTSPAHAETISGGLAHLSGSGEVVASVYDAVDDPTRTGMSFGTSGLKWMDNANGAPNQNFETVPQSNNIFSKSVTLGDVELRCDIPPVEVGNFVWEDLDGDGIQDPNEPVLAGITVELLEDTTGDGVGDTIIATAVTDENGNYLFSSDPTRSADTSENFLYDLGGFGPDGLPNTADDLLGLKPSFDANADGDFDDVGDIKNIYSIRVPSFQTQLPGLSPTVVDSDGLTTNTPLVDVRDSDGVSDGTNSVVTFTTGIAGDSNQSLDFAFATTPTGSIGDTIWIDENGDGIFDASETPLAEVTVILTNVATGVVTTMTTDENGQYSFNDLALGEYAVAVDTNTLPASLAPSFDSDGGNDSTSSVTLTLESPDNDAQDFAYVLEEDSVTIGGTLWFDADQDGVQDIGVEFPFAGITVNLYDSDGNLVDSTITDQFGNYEFFVSPNTQFSIRLDNASNFSVGNPLLNLIPTSQNAGGDDASDSDSELIDGFPVITITSPSEGESMISDFGFQGNSPDSHTIASMQVMDSGVATLRNLLARMITSSFRARKQNKSCDIRTRSDRRTAILRMNTLYTTAWSLIWENLKTVDNYCGQLESFAKPVYNNDIIASEIRGILKTMIAERAKVSACMGARKSGRKLRRKFFKNVRTIRKRLNLFPPEVRC